jgi:hypothetical protein
MLNRAERVACPDEAAGNAGVSVATGSTVTQAGRVSAGDLNSVPEGGGMGESLGVCTAP